jgi:predicted urease superfamily metal-dependent hydrolase
MTREEQIKAVEWIIKNVRFYREIDHRQYVDVGVHPSELKIIATAIVDAIGLNEELVKWSLDYWNNIKDCVEDKDCPRELIIAEKHLKELSQSKDIIKIEKKEK